MRVAVGVLIAVVVGVLIGRATAPSVVAPKAAPLTAGPTSERAGVRVGFPRTRQGAVLAAGSYQQAFTDRAILKPSVLRRRIDAVATSRFAPVMREVNEPGAWRLRVGEFGQGVRSHVASAFFGVPVAYRVLSFSRQRAVVQTWGFTLLGNVTSVEPTAYFGLARTVLAWRDDDWKIADTRASFGPTPRLVSPRPGGEGLSLVELSQELRPYALAP
jgi:hypothetical protein